MAATLARTPLPLHPSSPALISFATRRSARAAMPCVSPTRGEWLMFENHQKSEIDALLKSSTEFRSLYQRHQELDSKLRDADLGVLPMDDTTLHSLKKEKLRAKDRLVQLWDLR